MPARIRLQRFGKKGRPFYHIVIADGRAPRDGKYIENIGTYNPLTTPATIELNFDKAIQWLKNGASPSDTARAILSYKGVLYKYHLLKGVAKGALTEEQADAKFNAWITEKEIRIAEKIKNKDLTAKDAKKKALKLEVEVNQARENAQQAKLAKMAAKETAQEEEATEEVAVEEAPVVEADAVVEEATPVAEVVEEVAPVVEEEAPVVVAEEAAPEVTEETAVAPEENTEDK